MRLCASFILSNKIVSSNYKWINPTIIVSSKRGWNGIETTRGLINAIPYIWPRSRSSRIDFDNFVRVWRINVFLAIYRQPGLNVRKSRNRKYESNFKIVHPRGTWSLNLHTSGVYRSIERAIAGIFSRMVWFIKTLYYLSDLLSSEEKEDERKRWERFHGSIFK